MFTIHGTNMSFNTTKVIYTAEELGIKYDYVEMDLAKGDNKTPTHLKRHPLGKMPTLTQDQKTLFESGAICRYLASQSKTDLYGKDAFEHALTDQWMDFFSVHAGRWLGTLAFEKGMRKKFGMGEPKQDVIKESEGYLEQQLGMVNEHLAVNKHLAGHTFTIADLFAFAYMESTEISGFPITNFKNINTWYAALKERPCVINGKKKLKI